MMQQSCERRTLLTAHTYSITVLHYASASFSISWLRQQREEGSVARGGERSERGAAEAELQGPRVPWCRTAFTMAFVVAVESEVR